MIIFYFLEGLTIGFLLAMPVGPIGIICFRRTLAYGNYHGFIAGLSGASADVVYALVAAFGITLISDFVTELQYWIRLGGGILLLMMGLYIFRSHPSVQAVPKRSIDHAKNYISTFLLALTNPMTLFAYAAVFSTVRSGQIVDNRFFLPVLVTGVFFGSLSWFSSLIGMTYVFKKKLTSNGLDAVNRIAGCMLMFCGVVAIWTGVHNL
jgi:threonine/homoserine/homoserine lactone efflux protein